MRKCFSTIKVFVQGFKRMKSTEMATPPATEEHKTIMEGRAILRISSEKVFYNPVQEFNRDLSIAVLSVFVEEYKKEKLLESKKHRSANSDNFMEDEKVKLLESKKHRSANSDNFMEDEKVEITILEALSATGLRSIRYAKEVPDITKVIANDICEKAVKTIQDNIFFNNVDHIVETSHDDACLLMYKHKHRIKRFAAVDLDPYGSPAIFLDAAVQSVADGGLLLVTATDMAVLAGNSPETCYSKYGAISLKTKCCHEMALRILLQSIESHANRYSRYIVPLLSVSVDFYIRVFVKVYSGAGQCKNTTSKLSMVYHCVGCDSSTLQPLGAFKPNPTVKRPNQVKGYLPPAPTVGELCDNCNHKQQMGGPIWSAPLHSPAFVERVLELLRVQERRFGTARRLAGVLAVVGEELPAPLYYTLDRLCATVHSEMMPIIKFRSAILNAGYDVSFSHANKLSIKTNAPRRFVWDVMRTWVKQQPVKAAKMEANPIAKHILSQPVTHEVSLSERADANPLSRRDKQTRFQFNPTPHWGPGCRSTINTAENKNLKSKRNQNKKKSKFRYHKRRLSPPEDDEVSKKKTNEKRFLIDTTSDADSDGGTGAAEFETNVGSVATEPDPSGGNSEGDVNIATDESKQDNGDIQSSAEVLTSEASTDPKQ